MFTGTVPSSAAAEGRRLGGAVYAQLDHQVTSNVKLVGGFQTNKIGSIPLKTVPRGASSNEICSLSA